MKPAHYFPVSPSPLRMEAGLHKFGSDFGNGERDAHYFQIDSERGATLAQKKRAPKGRSFICGDDAAAVHVRECAFSFMQRTLAREHPFMKVEEARTHDDAFIHMALNIQEDFAVLENASGQGRIVALDVRFPSGWYPERLQGASFAEIHAPVPNFPSSAKQNAGMVKAMCERGPFVRFVWTLSARPDLDQAPGVFTRTLSWEDARELFFRVERQVTVPLPDGCGALFLIRTYVSPISSLSDEERAILVEAVTHMPDDIRAYKSLPRGEILRSLLVQ